MTREEDLGYQLFGPNLFEHATQREREEARREEPDEVWIIHSGRESPSRQPEYRFRGTETDAKRAAKALCGTYEREKLKHEER